MAFRLIRLAAVAGLLKCPPFAESDFLTPGIDKNDLHGLAVFLYWYRNLKTADSKATSHSQEESMFSLSRGAQINPQILRYTFH